MGVDHLDRCQRQASGFGQPAGLRMADADHLIDQPERHMQHRTKPRPVRDF